MSADQTHGPWIEPWPVHLPTRAGHPREQGIRDDLEQDVVINEMCADERWGVLERDRADYERCRALALDLATHAERGTLRFVEPELMRLAAETIDRFGYDHGRSFVQAVLDGDDVDSEHASVIANVRGRFSQRGLLAFAGWLTVHIAADEMWRSRTEDETS
jgi:hypothetical protein